MELFVENEISQYELERNKPMPNLLHSIVQGNLIFELTIRLKETFSILSEIDILMPEKPNSVPDIAIYPKLNCDFFYDELAMSEMPITAIEIITPPQSDNDILKKN